MAQKSAFSSPRACVPMLQAQFRLFVTRAYFYFLPEGDQKFDAALGAGVFVVLRCLVVVFAEVFLAFTLGRLGYNFRGEEVGNVAPGKTSSLSALPGVSVTVTNVDTNVSQHTQTDAVGQYRFLALPVGRYRLELRRSAPSPGKRNAPGGSRSFSSSADEFRPAIPRSGWSPPEPVSASPALAE
jgi:carboxypeptidase family protein